MGGRTSRKSINKKLIAEERAMLKKVWSEIESNLQYHANLFFLDFCKTYPKYTKYFTLDPDMPLTIDVQTSTKFMIIMDTMGYLLIYFYNKPKQFKFLIGYIAMVHKDMDIMKEDMTNFADNLINYLATSFPQVMTSESEPIVSKYVRKVTDGISRNIENFRGVSLSDDSGIKESEYSCMGRTYGERLIYGHKLNYWIKRKRMWEERLKDWKLRTRMTIISSKDSSTDEDEILLEKDNDASTIEIVESFQVLEPRKHSRIDKQLMDDNIRLLLPRHVALRTKRPGQTSYDAVEITDLTDENFDDQSQQSSKNDETSQINQPSISDLSILPSTSSAVDSSARRRRRQLKLTHNVE